jgi:hypothetical protein
MQPRDYCPFPYTPINDRPKLEWPGGALIAVWVIPNIEFFLLPAALPATLGYRRAIRLRRAPGHSATMATGSASGG